MKKEQLIKKIGDVVMKNSKKGVLTLTKFVGTYNYKSGYDSYFAVSVDANNTLIVYSYYQNDRHEHIDTCTYKLADLPEDELKEVYKNLNTDDEDSAQYAGWTNTEEKNLEILIANGIYSQPKKKKEAFIDVDSIPELENEKDAYWVDRDENVGIMKFRGTTALGERVYEVSGKGFIDRPFRIDDGARAFHEAKSYRRNKGVFLIVNGDDTDNYDLLFVPDKKTLLDLAKKERKIKTYYFINNILESWKRTTDKSQEIKKEGVVMFDDKDKAIAYYNEQKEAFIKKYKKLLEKLSSCKAEVAGALEGISLEKPHRIEAKDYEPGVKYFQTSWGTEFSEEPFTISTVEESTGLLFTDNGFVLNPNDKLMTVEDANNVKILNKYKSVSDYISEIDSKIGLLTRITEALENQTLLGDDVCCPSWFEEESKKLLKKKSDTLKKAMSTVTTS